VGSEAGIVGAPFRIDGVKTAGHARLGGKKEGKKEMREEEKKRKKSNKTVG
jgi:hypothetical protein